MANDLIEKVAEAIQDGSGDLRWSKAAIAVVLKDQYERVSRMRAHEKPLWYLDEYASENGVNLND